MKPGSKIQFREGETIYEGIVQGSLETFPSGESYVPVWVDARSEGREGTTIFVNLKNLVK